MAVYTVRNTRPHLRVIAIDSPALLQLNKKAQGKDEAESACEALRAHWAAFDFLISEGPLVPWVFVIGHHPLRTHGAHGGHRTGWRKLESIFPRADIQDMAHPANVKFRNQLETALTKVDAKVVYLAGHEHNLQLIEINEKLIQVVSGSAGKTSEVTHGSDTVYCNDGLGFVRFDIAEDQLWVEFISEQAACDNVTPLFRIAK